MSSSSIESGGGPSAGGLAAETRLGPVQLIVSDLERAVAFYSDVIGLQLHSREDQSAAMGAGGEDVLRLRELAGAKRAARHAGLYHVALLYESRLELARAAARLMATHTPIQGASDHGTHEAIYLADPDGNGLELAADRARELWPDLRNPTFLSQGPQPLDLDGLLSLVAGEPLPARVGPGLRVGHLHLHVADTEAALRFYRDVLGFEMVMDLMPSAGFVAAGGYHHHVAFNSWRGVGVPPAPPDAVGLDHFTVHVPTVADLQAVSERIARAGPAGVPVESQASRQPAGILVRDPSNNALLISTEPSRAVS